MDQFRDVHIEIVLGITEEHTNLTFATDKLVTFKVNHNMAEELSVERVFEYFQEYFDEQAESPYSPFYHCRHKDLLFNLSSVRTSSIH